MVVHRNILTLHLDPLKLKLIICSRRPGLARSLKDRIEFRNPCEIRFYWSYGARFRDHFLVQFFRAAMPVTVIFAHQKTIFFRIRLTNSRLTGWKTFPEVRPTTHSLFLFLLTCAVSEPLRPLWYEVIQSSRALRFYIYRWFWSWEWKKGEKTSLIPIILDSHLRLCFRGELDTDQIQQRER